MSRRRFSSRDGCRSTGTLKGTAWISGVGCHGADTRGIENIIEKVLIFVSAIFASPIRLMEMMDVMDGLKRRSR
jgi:hypothetical protein